jgi:serine/threonine protein phosphatase PrpC
MIKCPNCQAENRSGAKFCKNCAARLPETSAATRPLDEKHIPGNPGWGNPTPTNNPNPVTQRIGQASRSGTKPLKAIQAFIRRPTGAIFGDAFLYKEAIFSNEHQHRYQVTQLDVAEELQVRSCPNPACGAVVPPRGVAPEKFCTDCGMVLEKEGKDLVVIEVQSPIPDNIVRVIAKGLSHGSVRPPLAAFVEHLAGQPRHCTVVVRVGGLEKIPDSIQALKWGAGLARGLDYLHDNGVTFNGHVDPSIFGLDGERAVWTNFNGSAHHADGYVTDRQPDLKALALLVFHWLTGKVKFERDPKLSPGFNQVFEQVFTSSSIVNGSEFADALEKALEELTASQAIDHRSGRRTNVGMVRSLNEDSISTIEINRILQSISQPLAVYVVADGMGGHSAGEIASGTIVNCMVRRALKDLLGSQISGSGNLDIQRWLREAVEEANSEVFSMRKSAGTDMGSTLVSAVVEGSRAYIAHVGDSRAYLVNAKGIKQITVDHSLVERLIASKQITREEARHHPQRNVIYRTMGDKAKIDVEISLHTLEIGDCLLLCSDGLSGMLEDQTINRIVQESANPQAACDALIDAANAAGGEDNVSVIVVKIVEV